MAEPVRTAATRRASLRLILTDRCNLHCEYCHVRSSREPSAHLDPGEARLAVRGFAEYARTLGLQEAELSLYGGEPLLNVAALTAVLDEAARLGREGFRFDAILGTNGTLVSEGILPVLAAAGVQVSLSLDGASPEGNGLRVDRRGSPSFDRARAALRALRTAGCPVQLNATFAPSRLEGLASLVPLARRQGVARVFAGLVDTDDEVMPTGETAAQLLALRDHAEHEGIALGGPWEAGLRPPAPDDPWPPLRLEVRATGAVRSPAAPQVLLGPVRQVLGSGLATSTVPRAVQEALDRARSAWAEVLAGCDLCAIRSSCRGLAKLVVQYHTGSLTSAGRACALARLVEHRWRGEPRHRWLRASIDLDVRHLASGEVRVWNDTCPASSVVEVSPGALELLAYFSTGGTSAGVGCALEADNLERVVEQLTSRALLRPVEGDTDRDWLDRLGPVALQVELGGLRTAVARPTDRPAMDVAHARMVALVEGFPSLLREARGSLCVFGAGDTAAARHAFGWADARPDLEWVIASVRHSVLVIDLPAFTRAATAGGRAWQAHLDRGLGHELLHLALRRSGIRVPTWLEEGLCEHLTGVRPPAHALAMARADLRRFVAFISATGSPDGPAPRTSLLALSTAPTGENPVYLLALDLVTYVAERLGPDSLLHRLHAAGARALADPWPALCPGDDRDAWLAGWVADVRRRVAALPGAEASGRIRAVRQGERVILYDRLVGGHLVLAAADVEGSPLARPAQSLDAIEPLLRARAADPAVLRRWAGVPRSPPRHPPHLRLYLTWACNLACRYCYAARRDGPVMSVDVLRRAVAVWMQGLDPTSVERATVRFFGGEPLQCWSLILEALTLIQAGLPGNGPCFLINTNGTLLEEAHLRTLGALGPRCRVSVSCDGVGEVHDAARRRRDGTGTFAAVDEALHRLAAAGVPVALSCVVGPHNAAHLDALVDYAMRIATRARGPVGLTLDPCLPREGEPGVESSVARALLAAVERGRRLGLAVHGTATRAGEALRDPAAATGCFCAASGAELGVGPGGEIVLCPALPDRLGSLEDVERAGQVAWPEDVLGRRAGQLASCSGCEVEGLCGGGCLAVAARSRGSRGGRPDASYCGLIRDAFDQELSGLAGRAR